MDREFKASSTTESENSVLVVGDGDFSFSVAFISRYPTLKLTATTLETSSLMSAKYPNFLANHRHLLDNGVMVHTGVDATQLHEHFKLRQFSHILFNFPHVGGKSNIKKNRHLLDSFFKSASNHITEHGKVLVTLCKGQGGTGADKPRREWCNSWQVAAKAANSMLILTSVDAFEGKAMFEDYLSTGFRSQNKMFHTEGSLVHKFEKSSPCPAAHLLLCEPPTWRTETNLWQDLVNSITESWNLSIGSENSPQVENYEDLYCCRASCFSYNTTDQLTPISYGGNFYLHNKNGQVTLSCLDGTERVVGSSTSTGTLSINLSDILKQLYRTNDSRYFTNNSLRKGRICQQISYKYDVVSHQPTSIYPPEYSFDISFWLPEAGYKKQSFLSLVYKLSMHLVRDVTLLDVYVDSESVRTSHCYRVVYQSLDTALSYAHAYSYYQVLRDSSSAVLNVSLR